MSVSSHGLFLLGSVIVAIGSIRGRNSWKDLPWISALYLTGNTVFLGLIIYGQATLEQWTNFEIGALARVGFEGTNETTFLAIQFLLLLQALGLFLNKAIELQTQQFWVRDQRIARAAFETWLAYRLTVTVVLGWVAALFYWSAVAQTRAAAAPQVDAKQIYASGFLGASAAVAFGILLLVCIGTARGLADWAERDPSVRPTTLEDRCIPLTRIWMGMDLEATARLLIHGRFAVDLRYTHVALMIGGWSLLNTMAGPINRFLVRRALRDCRLNEKVRGGCKNPVFILGHWRTGTTLLHEALSLHPNLTAPNCFECFVPNASMAIDERFAKRWLPMSIPPERPMDRVKLDWHAPQEDEFAMMNMGHRSPYVRFAFPRTTHRSGRLAELIKLDEGATARWVQDLRAFITTVLVRRAHGFPAARRKVIDYRREDLPRVVLKSPPHTARLALLMKEFPEASFVCLHRDPNNVLPSTAHLWRETGRSQGLQTAGRAFSTEESLLDSAVLEDFEFVHEEYSGAIEGELAAPVLNVDYRDIDVSRRSPESVAFAIGKILAHIGVDRDVGPAMLDFLRRSHLSYVRNERPQLDEEERIRAWPYVKKYCAHFGYKEWHKMPPPPHSAS